MIKLIGLRAPLMGGKDTVAIFIQALARDTFENKKFAYKLKQMAGIMLGEHPTQFESQEFKASLLPEEWSYVGPSIQHGHLCTDDLVEKQMTVREFLQRLGTDAVRDGLHQNAWVNALFSDYKSVKTGQLPEYVARVDGKGLLATGMNEIYEYPNWIISDTRYPNEAQAIKDKGGIVVNIIRDVARPKYTRLEDLHPSETSLDNWPFDYHIDNNSGIEELRERVREMLIHFNIPLK